MNAHFLLKYHRSTDRKGAMMTCSTHARLVVALLLMLLALPAAATPLVNGDFAAGFDGWSGDLSDFFTGTTFPADPTANPAHYRLVGGGLAELGFDPVNPDLWQVFLYQDFSIGDPGNALELVLEWDWNPSDAGVDFFQIDIRDGFGNTFSVVDALFGIPPSFPLAAAADLRSDTLLIPGGFFADTTLTFTAGITELDFDPSDTLRIGNISLTEPAAAPLPGTLALGGVGLFGLLATRRVRRKSMLGSPPHDSAALKGEDC